MSELRFLWMRIKNFFHGAFRLHRLWKFWDEDGRLFAVGCDDCREIFYRPARKKRQARKGRV